MKVNIKDNSTSTEIKYPCLMIKVDENKIVLFVSPTEGTILSSVYNNVGYNSNLLNIHKYKPFTGTIELSND